jgi:hypothetical protein
MTHVAHAVSAIGTASRRKAAELLSTTGALVLGVGIGLALPAVGSAIAWLIIALGIISHGWGMYAKNSAEVQSGDVFPWWHGALYWGCWIALAALAAYLAVGWFSS